MWQVSIKDVFHIQQRLVLSLIKMPSEDDLTQLYAENFTNNLATAYSPHILYTMQSYAVLYLWKVLSVPRCKVNEFLF